MQIVFNHGQESGPIGTKIECMAAVAEGRGYDWTSIDYQDLRDEPDARVARLLEHLQHDEGACALVGSSMGGYVASVAAARHPVAGLFLIAPALYVGGPYTVTEHHPETPVISVMHGWHDDLISWEDSVRFAHENRATLHLLDDEHSLNADMNALAGLFGLFLDRLEQA